MSSKTDPVRELTLRDLLSRLSYQQACKLLGPEAKQLLAAGGKREVIIDEQVHLGADLFRLRLPDATVTITLMAEARDRLRWNCTACRPGAGACEHVGTAFSLVLEEKLALGLAAAPPERKPVESLAEEELVRLALQERQERAQLEKMRIRSSDVDTLWTDYVVTNAESGRTYRVALRGWQAGESYCSCPDFRKNTLGTCKHILQVQHKMRARFPAAVREQPYEPTELAVYIRHGREAELRMLVPRDLEASASAIVKPVRDRAIDDVPDLLGRIGKLASLGLDVTVFPDAEEYVNQRLFELRIAARVAEIRKAPAKHALRKELLKVELLPYQLDGIAFAVGAGRAVLADDMGLGKTIQGIGVAELLAREAQVSKVLVVCPATLKSQWRSEIERFCDRSCQLILGPLKERAGQYGNDCFFTVCNYEQVLRDIMAIEQVKWGLIILDEGQRIKNWQAKTSGVVKALKSPFALVLSGTPMENRLDELYSVVEFIDDRRLGPAFRFLNRHRTVDDRGRVLGYKNLAELRERLSPILLRRTRGSVMRDLPPRTTEVVRIAPTGEQIEFHRGQSIIIQSIVNKKYISEMDLLRLQKALLMCRMVADSTFLVDKQPPGYSTKLERLDDLLGEFARQQGRKAVLFSEWTTMLGLIEPLLDKHGLGYVRLDGSIPQAKRRQIVHAFRTDPAKRVFITTNAGATGLNLQAADTVFNVDLPWNPAVLEQRIARAHRMGQTRPVQVYVLVTEGTLEEKLLATLSAKHELAQAALDVDSDVDAVELVSGMEELKRRLETLLGAKPEAPVDVSEAVRKTEEARRLARREKVAEAGGQLLTAAFSFLGELVPAGGPAEPSRELADAMKRRLAECLETGEDGKLKLTVRLPDAAALDTLAESLARLLARPQ
jgi:superfamily II DNA or RNA helicase